MMKSGKKQKAGNRDIFNDYTVPCRYKCKWHKSLYNYLTKLAALYIHDVYYFCAAISFSHLR